MTDEQQRRGQRDSTAPAVQQRDADPPTRTDPRYVGLLTQITDNTLDEDYQAVAEKQAASGSRPHRRAASGVIVGLALFGLMLGIAALSTQQNQPRLEAEREELIHQIQSRESQLDELQRTIGDLRDELTVLQENVAEEVDSSSALRGRLDDLGIAAGTIGVSGPGIVVTTDDAPGADAESGGVIRDHDLQALVNGLWAAGAEAIAIDDRRLTSLTAIRFAGEAITVDYQSLSPPYVVEAIGNPETLPAQLAQTEGGQLWLSLELNFGIRYDYQTEENIILPGDPHDHLNYAERAKR